MKTINLTRPIGLVGLITLSLLLGCLMQASQLVWSPNPPAELVWSYNVYAAPPGATNFTFVGNTTTTNYDIGRPPFGTRFYITAVNPQEESDPSNVATNIVPGSPFIRIKK